MLGLGLTPHRNVVLKNIVKDGLIMWLDGRDFSNNPPATVWKDRSQGSQYTYTNLVTNGDFSSGTTGWSGAGTVLNVSNDVMNVTATGQYGALFQNKTNIFIVGHKYYASAIMSGKGINYLKLQGAQANITAPFDNILVSLIVTASTTYMYLEFGDGRSSDWTPYSVDNVLVVDLTATFGVGNEPSRDWCKNNLGFVTTTGIVNKPNDATPSNFAYLYNAPTKITTDFNGKTAGDLTSNVNVSKHNNGINNPNLYTPSTMPSEGSTTGVYDKIKTLDGIITVIVANVSNSIPQQSFQFNVVSAIEKQLGYEIPTSDGTLASKVAWAKSHVSKIECDWTGFGSCPTGSKAYLNFWKNSTNTWEGNGYNTSDTPASLSQSVLSSWSDFSVYIDNNGYTNFLAHTDPARTTDSTLLILTGHGLSANDIIDNETKGLNGLWVNAKITPNTLAFMYPTGSHESGDAIRKYHYYKNQGASPGTDNVTVKAIAHGLSTGDYIKNTTRGYATSKITVVDTDTFTCDTPITGQTAVDNIYYYRYSGTQHAEGQTNTVFLGLTNHGLVTNDIVQNVTRNICRSVKKITDNSVLVATINGQVTGDTIKKYRIIALKRTAESGTTSTTVVVTNHGLVTGDIIRVEGRGYSNVTKIDNNTITLDTPISGTTVGDSIVLGSYFGTQTANDIIIPSTICTDYVNCEVILKDANSGSDGQGVVFDGIDDYLIANSNLQTKFGTGEFSLSTKINLQNGATLSTESDLYGIYFCGTWSNKLLLLSIRGGVYNGCYCRVWNGSSYNDLKPTSNKSSIFLDYKSHYITAVRTVDNVGKLFIDGVLVGTIEDFSGDVNNTSFSPTIGVQNPNNTLANYFKGTISNVLFYNRALTDMEIKRNYNALR